jgi:hypothetical protein
MNLRLINISLGFFFLFASASGGFFLALLTQLGLDNDTQLLSSKLYIMQKSAHSHTNLFALIHIVFALTLNDSKLSDKIKKYQSYSLVAGTLSMSLMMLLRSFFSKEIIVIKYTSAIFLCAYLLALLSHCYGVVRKLLRL